MAPPSRTCRRLAGDKREGEPLSGTRHIQVGHTRAGKPDLHSQDRASRSSKTAKLDGPETPDPSHPNLVCDKVSCCDSKHCDHRRRATERALGGGGSGVTVKHTRARPPSSLACPLNGDTGPTEMTTQAEVTAGT